MVIRIFSNSSTPKDQKAVLQLGQQHPLSSTSPPLNYSWILNHRLAIGPVPRTAVHWQQLEADGFRLRFSCCYPHELVFTPIPSDWKSSEVPLPDHRAQESLTFDTLTRAINSSLSLLNSKEGPLYLHCFAGQERSSLIAVGLVSIDRNLDLYASLNYVKQCHRRAKPIYDHLELLEHVLKQIKSS